MELSNFAVICMLLLAAVFQLSMGQEWGIAYGKRASQVVYYNHLNNHYINKNNQNSGLVLLKRSSFSPKTFRAVCKNNFLSKVNTVLFVYKILDRIKHTQMYRSFKIFWSCLVLVNIKRFQNWLSIVYSSTTPPSPAPPNGVSQGADPLGRRIIFSPFFHFSSLILTVLIKNYRVNKAVTNYCAMRRRFLSGKKELLNQSDFI